MHAFLTIAFIHFLAMASPGPDFAIIVKQCLTRSRTNVLWTALGVALGILVHVAYSLLGIGLIVSKSIVIFNVIKYLGAAYLIYIGIKSLRSKHQHTTQVKQSETVIAAAPMSALRTGFLTNALNPKVTLFFLALFTQVIKPDTPVAIQMFYGAYMSFVTFVWFATLGMVLSADRIQNFISAIHLWAERIMGVVLIALGIRVALATRE